MSDDELAPPPSYEVSQLEYRRRSSVARLRRTGAHLDRGQWADWDHESSDAAGRFQLDTGRRRRHGTVSRPSIQPLTVRNRSGSEPVQTSLKERPSWLTEAGLGESPGSSSPSSARDPSSPSSSSHQHDDFLSAFPPLTNPGRSPRQPNDLSIPSTAPVGYSFSGLERNISAYHGNDSNPPSPIDQQARSSPSLPPTYFQPSLAPIPSSQPLLQPCSTLPRRSRRPRRPATSYHPQPAAACASQSTSCDGEFPNHRIDAKALYNSAVSAHLSPSPRRIPSQPNLASSDTTATQGAHESQQRTPPVLPTVGVTPTPNTTEPQSPRDSPQPSLPAATNSQNENNPHRVRRCHHRPSRRHNSVSTIASQSPSLYPSFSVHPSPSLVSLSPPSFLPISNVQPPQPSSHTTTDDHTQSQWY